MNTRTPGCARASSAIPSGAAGRQARRMSRAPRCISRPMRFADNHALGLRMSGRAAHSERGYVRRGHNEGLLRWPDLDSRCIRSLGKSGSFRARASRLPGDGVSEQLDVYAQPECVRVESNIARTPSICWGTSSMPEASDAIKSATPQFGGDGVGQVPLKVKVILPARTMTPPLGPPFDLVRFDATGHGQTRWETNSSRREQPATPFSRSFQLTIPGATEHWEPEFCASARSFNSDHRDETLHQWRYDDDNRQHD